MNSAVEFSLNDFPGYSEAVAKENEIRSRACLGINEVICGLEVKPLCAFHVQLFLLVRSPFLGAYQVEQLMDKPDILADIMRFLWIVSPMYRQEAPPMRPGWLQRRFDWRKVESPRDRFNVAYGPIMKQKLDTVIREILDYINDSFSDAEPGEKDAKSYYAFEVSIAHELHEHYGYRIDFWNPYCPASKNPMLVPLKIVFQLRKLRAQIAGAASVNKSDKLIELGLAEIAKRKK
jgi:hypothetical protein